MVVATHILREALRTVEIPSPAQLFRKDNMVAISDLVHAVR